MRNPYQLARSVRILVTVSLVAIPFGLMAPPAIANDPVASATSSPESAAPKASRSYKPYFVEFRSRAAASYGHMYLLYGQLNGQGERLRKLQSDSLDRGAFSVCALRNRSERR